MDNIQIDFLELKNQLKSLSQKTGIGIYVEGESNTVSQNNSNCGIQVKGLNNTVDGNTTNWLMVQGEFNDVTKNKIIENINNFSPIELRNYLDVLDNPNETNKSTITQLIQKLFSGVSVTAGISLINIPGIANLYIELNKKLS